jgi:hypothetical protein
MIGNSFSCRLISKFRPIRCRAWIDDGFVPTHSDILFPDAYDPWFKQVKQIKAELEAEGSVGEVLSTTD